MFADLSSNTIWKTRDFMERFKIFCYSIVIIFFFAGILVLKQALAYHLFYYLRLGQAVLAFDFQTSYEGRKSSLHTQLTFKFPMHPLFLNARRRRVHQKPLFRNVFQVWTSAFWSGKWFLPSFEHLPVTDLPFILICIHNVSFKVWAFFPQRTQATYRHPCAEESFHKSFFHIPLAFSLWSFSHLHWRRLQLMHFWNRKSSFWLRKWTAGWKDGEGFHSRFCRSIKQSW